MSSHIAGLALVGARTLTLAAAHARPPTVAPEDRFALIDAATGIAAGADRGQWERVRGAFADAVTLDYTSLFGGAPTTLSADDVIAAWSGVLPGFDATQHLATNHAIVAFDGDAAEMEADFQATHRLGDARWVLSGRYVYGFIRTLSGWKINALTMTWTDETGDRGLLAVAAHRVADQN